MNNTLIPERKNTAELSRKIRKIEKNLRKKSFYSTRLEKELLFLRREESRYTILFENNAPLVGSRILELDEITDENVIELLNSLSETLYLTNDEFLSLVWQCRFLLLERACSAVTFSEISSLLYAVSDLSPDFIAENASPLARLFSADPTYLSSDEKTKALYRLKTAQIASESGIDEKRLSSEQLSRSKSEEAELGEIIENDFRRVFRIGSSGFYISALVFPTLLISLFIGLSTDFLCAVAAFVPLFGAVKALTDIIFPFLIKPDSYLPRLKIGGISEKNKTAVVISTLISDSASVNDALSRLRAAQLRNNEKNVAFCLLCDLPSAKTETLPTDKALLSEIPTLVAASGVTDCAVFVRKRSYSKTQRCWQGRERKRGAIEELIRFIKGERADFAGVFGSSESVVGVKFLIALDYDTLPLMDSVRELVSIALHPLNKRFGIIAPRISSSLCSTLRTPFARYLDGNGGTSSASLYDSNASELYFSCFNEGIFTGKGLVRVDDFYDKLIGKFPPERVLSHDILEGGIMNVAFAGDIEFSESFPPNSKAYFKRLHRWVRGDFQNFRFLFGKDFSVLTRLKLLDNIRRALAPLFVSALFVLACFNNTTVLVTTALLCLFAPLLPSFIFSLLNSMSFGIVRRFYSPVVAETKRLLIRLPLEIMLLPYNAVTSTDALFKTVWRMITKRKLLEWTTSNVFDRRSDGFFHLLPSLLLSLALLCTAVFFNAVPVMIIAALSASGVPVLMRADCEELPSRPVITPNMRLSLIKEAGKMWNYYAENCTERNNFLPPDNIQLSPVYREATRTSPTNIGMYLLSCVCVRELGIISTDELFSHVRNSVSTLLRLKKWNGNLFNWYDTETLEVISPFVSCVDSGNFLCCLVAVKEAMRSLGAEKSLVESLETLIGEADLSVFYNERKKLFSIGFDVEKNELSKNHYDMLMSEARMTSYFAIARGFVGKEHYRALSRIMSRCGNYAGPISWTGTMFEFFMPELLLSSKKGSLSSEALSYALYCQKRRFLPWGISESAYYAFDKDLNYQYKAHGVQRVALKANMNRDCVISPYSSFLTLPLDAVSSYNNLCRIEKLGACGKYGFYEAIDFTPSRVGKGFAVIRSFMAHHIGMSIVALTNALCDNLCPVLFLRDKTMQRASELLEEKVISGEKILGIPERKEEPPMLCESEKIENPDPTSPKINILSNSALTLFTADNGSICALCDGNDVVKRTSDFVFRPHGEFFSFSCEGEILPMFTSPLLENCHGPSVTFSPLETTATTKTDGLELEMTTTLFKTKTAYLHTFSAENTSSHDKTVVFRGFIEPALARNSDLTAHPAFSDLFLRIKKEGELFIAERIDRNNGNGRFLALGEIGLHNPSYSFSREDVITDNEPFSFLSALPTNSENEIPSPCVFLYAEIPLKKGERKEFTLFCAVGKTKTEAEIISRKIKELHPTPFINPLSRTTLHGVTASKLAAAVLYPVREIKNTTLRKDTLWGLGVSGELPIVLLNARKNRNDLASAIKAHSLLCLSGLISELVITCAQTEKTELDAFITDLGVVPSNHVFILEDLSPEISDYLSSIAVFEFGESAEAPSEKPFLPIIKADPCSEENGFDADGFCVSKAPRPWCNVLSNQRFGTLVSNASLGFSWAFNSHENKLSPWYNDPCLDNDGELLLLEAGGKIFNIINGSTARFTPESAEYCGICENLRAKTSVCVFENEMGKEITVSVENLSENEITANLSFALCPPRLSSITPHKSHVTLKNLNNTDFDGESFVSVSRPFSLSGDRLAFYRGEKSEQNRGGFAAVTVPLKLPPKSREITRYIFGWTGRDNPGLFPDQSRKPGFTPGNKLTLFSPDEKLNALFNRWLPWQALGCRLWARTGFYQNGGAYGFRDQLQDCLSILYLMPSEAEKHIMRCCEAQFSEGDVLHWWHEVNGKLRGVRTRCSDDMLWLPYVSCVFAETTANSRIWDKTAVFASAPPLSENEQERYAEVEKGTVPHSLYEHCKVAIEKGFNKGMFGLIRIGCGDWNDGYSEVGGKNGEGVSVWLSMFYIMCARKFATVARERNDSVYAEALEKRIADLARSVEENAWNDGYYVRAFFPDGEKMGAKGNSCCEIDLLPQAFSVLCGLPDRTRARQAVEKALELLVDRKNNLIKLFSPPFAPDSEPNPGYVSRYPEGIRENGGQYTHAAVWLCLACFKLGMKDEGFMLLEMLNPAKRDEKFRNEPYFMTADIYSNEKCAGMGGWSLYTGTASWYYKAVLEGLLGAKLRGDSLTFSPNLPDSFDGTSLSITTPDSSVNVTFRKSKDSNINNESVTLRGNIHNFNAIF